MAKKYLIVDPGSSSLKLSIYEDGREILFRHYENLFSAKPMESALDKFLKSASNIAKIGVRVVSPGKFFQKDRAVDDAYLRQLAAWNIDPAHSRQLALLKKLKKIFPDSMIIGISDTAFHARLPEVSRYYALPRAQSDRLEILRFGYHGLSLESAVAQVKAKFGKIPAKMIVCHLGSGSSITALRNGKSIDTSMGFSPLEGLVTSSRVGDIDPAAVIHLAKRKKMNLETLRNYLYNKSGLLGLSGQSADLRVLLKSKNPRARLAVSVFVHRIVKYVGAYTAVLGGLDCLVFTGTIGERNARVRKMIYSNLRSLGKNKVAVVRADENLVMLKRIL